jgi:hypothetical protein
MNKWKRVGLGVLMLALSVALVAALAACGDDDGDDDADAADTPESAADATAAVAAPDGGVTFDPGPGLGPDFDGGPGCSDPNDDECPMPLQLDLDGQVDAGGVSIRYAQRYFDASTGEADPLISIVPSERNRFEETANFEVYFADSVGSATAGLVDPQTADWSTETLTGTIGVMRDASQDPPVNTAIGSFPLEDGRVLVFELVSTGKYGWDLYATLYASMLDTLTVAP